MEALIRDNRRTDKLALLLLGDSFFNLRTSSADGLKWMKNEEKAEQEERKQSLPGFF